MIAPDGEPLDVLIVGAGTTGLAAALFAHDYGAHVRIIDRRPDAPRFSRAFLVQPRTLEVLRPHGVIDELLALGDPSPQVHLHLRRRCVPVRPGELRLPNTAFPNFLLVRQADVEAVLRRALRNRGVEVEWESQFTSYRADKGVVCEVTHHGVRRQIAARFLIGCDGSTSTVRATAGISWDGAAYPREILLADVELDGDVQPGIAHIGLHRQGLLFLLPTGEAAQWRVLTAQPPNRTHAPTDRHHLQHLFDRAHLHAHITGIPWSERVRVQHRIASRYRRGPVFLAGDAAHTFSPAGGQGMNTGIQDAAGLGWKLAFAARLPGRSNATLLRSYAAERRPVAQQVLLLTHLLFWAEAGRGPVPSLLRIAFSSAGAPLVPLLLRRRRLLTYAVQLLAQLRRHYRHSPLTVEDARGSTAVAAPAGERIPDEEVTVNGARQQLHHLIATPAIHMLLQRDTSWEVPLIPNGRLRVHRVRSWPGTGTVIVRPDGYIGFRSGSGTQGATEWLTLVGASPTRS
ncbi:FAD-dependent monooxygenase [Rhodococcus koreensis]|uniref:2-polyprenyl-6-methoxyphenol hydroxylase n=1 Tax=Rhodococcus koreensis TaxID=99653 RepID=A0A1H4IF10_9NOCA|nr:FAD-dependent monooxygenase [Rhodococcus koreensis]SEB31852.1 2-polyprenyl-6-methoxyphenol hydroxylase [Rhodococcus koreensis]